jgi:hypothetical protein
MTQNSAWQQAKKQAEQIGKIKNPSVRSAQIVLLCETLKKALGGARG